MKHIARERNSPVWGSQVTDLRSVGGNKWLDLRGIWWPGLLGPSTMRMRHSFKCQVQQILGEVIDCLSKQIFKHQTHRECCYFFGDFRFVCAVNP